MRTRNHVKDFETKLEAELRRGVLQIAVLALAREPTYGYQLLKDLSGRGLETEEGTLYPILRRLETRGLVESSWRTDGPRPRKYYQTTAEGRATLGNLFAAWHSIQTALTDIEDGTGKHES